MNYVKLMNWFWQELPYREGYKSEYGMVFLAVVDLCNRNDWRETSAEYDRMINKVKVSKKLYYEAIKWLVNQEAITYQRGYNDYSPAKFSVKAEVYLCTSTDTTAVPLQHHCDTSTDTTAIPTAVPIIDKPLNLKTDKPINNKGGGKSSASVKVSYRPLVQLTETELTTLVTKHGQQVTDLLLDKLDAYKLANGKKYASDYGAINQWVVTAVLEDQQRTNRNRTGPPPTRPAPNPNALSHSDLIDPERLERLRQTQAKRHQPEPTF